MTNSSIPSAAPGHEFWRMMGALDEKLIPAQPGWYGVTETLDGVPTGHYPVVAWGIGASSANVYVLEVAREGDAHVSPWLPESFCTASERLKGVFHSEYRPEDA